MDKFAIRELLKNPKEMISTSHPEISHNRNGNVAYADAADLFNHLVDNGFNMLHAYLLSCIDTGIDLEDIDVIEYYYVEGFLYLESVLRAYPEYELSSVWDRGITGQLHQLQRTILHGHSEGQLGATGPLSLYRHEIAALLDRLWAKHDEVLTRLKNVESLRKALYEI